MKQYIVLFDDGKGIAPYVYAPTGEDNTLQLYTGLAIDLLLDKHEQQLCVSQSGLVVYTVVVKTLPSNMVAFDVTKHVKQLSPITFWALKVFTLKCKFSAVAQMAMEKHGPEQQNNWFKVIGMMEPIFNGGWM